MKGIFIDSENREVKEVDVDLTRDKQMNNDIHRLIKADGAFQIYKQLENHDLLFGDDNALEEFPDGTPKKPYGFRFEGKNYPSSVVIMGSDENADETLDVVSDLDDIKAKVVFLRREVTLKQ